MDKTSAQRVVSETFKASFDRKRFRDFISELCNGFDESKAISSMRVPDAFSDHIKSCQRLGTFESADGELADVLIVHLTESYKLERSRTALRDFVAHKLKREESYKEAGLVAFVAPGSQSWRFSYVRMEYETRRDPTSGKIKVEERLTPARRYSYLVGADEVCHTAQSRFLPLLQNTSDKPTLAQIENAFSVESVSKEFFAEYARLFVTTEAALADLVEKDKTLRADFEAKHVNTADFTKKLLGQIVFLYFIQKKGWLGVAKGGKWGDGPRDFMRQRAIEAISKQQNLFNDVLEPLFYDTLATDRGHEAWCKTFQCRIPFLNGGLFEPLAGYDWENTEITLPNTLLTNRETNKAGDTGTGILDVFDRYNFTVMEDEPLEKEVAIDPEMLGKVFENLIEENRRKGLGTFYTPREIVHYMCQESLINYLDTALNHPLKPIGMATPEPKAVHATVRGDTTVSSDTTVRGEPVEPPQLPLVPREELAEWISQSDQFAHYAAAIAAGTKGDHYPKPPASIRKYAREIDELLRDITVCDPAVGSGAFLVGMMNEIVRARMALTPYFPPLPVGEGRGEGRTAYHFKRRAIQNSLYGVDIDAGAVEIAKLRLWLSLVVDEEDVQQIKPLPNLDYKIVAGNSLIGFPFKSDRIHDIEKLKQIHFDETDHDKKIALKDKIDSLIHECFANSERSLGYEVTFDFKIYFSEVFQAKGGFDVVIANPPYDEISDKSQTKYFKTHYSDVLSGHYDLYIFFFRRAFTLARKGATITFITPHTYLQYSQYQRLRSWLYSNSHICEVTSRIEGVFESAVVDNAIIILNVGVASPEQTTLFSVKKIEKSALFNLATKALTKSAFSDAAFDLAAIENASFIARLSPGTELLGDVVESTQGITVYAKVQGEKIDHFRETSTDQSCKPVTRGREISKYQLEWSGRFIRYGDWLWCRRNPMYFDSPKILLRQTADTLIGTFVEEPMYCIDSVHSLISKQNKTDYDLKFILGIINSKLGAHIYEKLICETGKVFAQVKLTFLRRFPIKIAPRSNQFKIVQLVDKILEAKQLDVDSDTSALEREIDVLVYALYGLTPDEIALIEAAR